MEVLWLLVQQLIRLLLTSVPQTVRMCSHVIFPLWLLLALQFWPLSLLTSELPMWVGDNALLCFTHSLWFALFHFVLGRLIPAQFPNETTHTLSKQTNNQAIADHDRSLVFCDRPTTRPGVLVGTLPSQSNGLGGTFYVQDSNTFYIQLFSYDARAAGRRELW